ncbi:MAG: hypothetical protein Q8J68_02475 [Methanolobus sp.]|uniref:hypothetical protein n=1 Tax=Methanolobus sp. TaxID=1874737 RepID=UPI002731F22F|nr:hypothetical protein [Methanolobus sp.]MDP2216140.1 hypothetical protein [Methanolobus sp.]
MPDTYDMVIFWAVIMARFFLPLAIPRYPLPGVIGSLILDTIDQTIFQLFTSLPLEGYQSYDKALDIYYLTITYLSTMRNWTNDYAFGISRFLFYYRLVGVVLFELTQVRTLLLLFPNTFEYFFIFYEAVRLKWNPVSLTKKQVLTATALIWILIKLPQEYWIHVAQLDTTDLIKAYPPFALVLVAWAALIVVAAFWILKGLPHARDGFALAADPIPENLDQREAEGREKRFFDSALREKIIFVSLLGIIFASMLPGVRATSLQITIAVAFIIIVNTALSQWIARHGTKWSSLFREFAFMSVANLITVLVYFLLLSRYEGSINLANTLFFILLLTLNVTLYDRYRRVYLQRQLM